MAFAFPWLVTLPLDFRKRQTSETPMGHSMRSSPLDMIKAYSRILLRKMGFIALGWVVVYFVSQPMRYVPKDGGVNFSTLVGLVLGGFAGLVAGWYLATDAVEDSNMHGVMLWVILVLASVIPMVVVEGILRLILRWPMEFGGYMVFASAVLMALAAAVWHASSQE